MRACSPKQERNASPPIRGTPWSVNILQLPAAHLGTCTCTHNLTMVYGVVPHKVVTAILAMVYVVVPHKVVTAILAMVYVVVLHKVVTAILGVAKHSYNVR